MKLQEQYQELDDHPHSHTQNHPTSQSSNSSSSHGTMSINSSMLHNLSSNNDNNTTLPMTNGVHHQLHQQQQQEEVSSPSMNDHNNNPKKNRRLLWLCLLLLLIGMIVIVFVTTRVVKHTQLRSKSSSRSSSIQTTPQTEAMSSTSASSTNIPKTTTMPPMVNTTFVVTSSSPSMSPLLQWTRRPAPTPTLLVVNTTTATSTISSTVVVPSTVPSHWMPSTSPSVTVTLESTSSSVPPTIPPSIHPTAFQLDVPNPEELYHHLYVTQKIPNQFRIKMHYESQYLWQDETIERRWCIECTTCPYNNFDLSNTVCDIVHQCTIGNQIWIVNCDANYGQIFTIRPHVLPNISPNESRTRMHNASDIPFVNYYYHQIQIVQNATSINTGVYTNGNPSVQNQTNFTSTLFTNDDYLYNNLCLTRTETRYVTIQVCQNYTDHDNNIEYDASQLAQLWDPFVPYHYRPNNATTNIISNDDITISNTSYPTFTITPGIRLSNGNDVVVVNMTTTTDTDTDDTNHNNNHTNTTITTTTTTTTSWCLTNQHHPKSEEIVALKPCTISHQYHTGLWNFYPLP